MFEYIGYLFLLFRIILLGLERIFLKKLQDYDSVVVAGMFFFLASIFLLPIFFFIPKSAITLFSYGVGIALVSSIIYSFGFFTYVKALSQEDASLIAPLYNSSLLWLMILGYLFLREDVGPLRVLGGFIMLVGLFFLYPGNFKKKMIAIKESKASLYMILGSVFIAVGRTIDGFAINPHLNAHPIDERYYAFLINVFIGVYLLIFSIGTGKGNLILKVWREQKKMINLAGIVNGWSYLFLLIAFLYIDVTVAEPASLLSVFTTAFFAKIILKEKVNQRIPGMIIMVVGAFLLFT